MLREIWSRLTRPAVVPPDTGGYRAYTTRFDLELRADELAKAMGWWESVAFSAHVAELDRAMAGWRAAADIAAIEAIDRLRIAGDAGDLGDTVACLLIDHSGSMRGQRAIIAVALAEITAEIWSRLGMCYEILGFTTRSWRGGRSRRSWIWAGRPPHPGRLCDLLHIIYRSADQTAPGAPSSIRNLMRGELLKENIDGEAVLWAAHRLRARPEARKILIVVSDGAPVDDSTLSANDPDILGRHLRQVVADIGQAGDIKVAAIGLDHEMFNVYPEYVVVRGVDDLSNRLIPFLTGLCRAPPSDIDRQVVTPT
jgi:cobaltochelatase CobT